MPTYAQMSVNAGVARRARQVLVFPEKVRLGGGRQAGANQDQTPTAAH